MLLVFRMKMASSPDIQMEGRAAIYSSFLGPSDAESPADQSSQFKQASSAVREAAIDFTDPEKSLKKSEKNLKQVFTLAVETLRGLLEPLSGTPLTVSDEVTEQVFQDAVEVLNEDKVAKVFVPRASKMNPSPLSRQKY